MNGGICRGMARIRRRGQKSSDDSHALIAKGAFVGIVVDASLCKLGAMFRHAASTVMVMALCSVLTACGSSDAPSGGGGGGSVAGAGGTSSNGGSSMAGSETAGSSTGGSDSGVVRGAFSINVQSGNGCALSAQTQDYPVVSSGHPVSATAKGQGIADQEVDATGIPALVNCTWFSDTAPFMIDAGITLGPINQSREFTINSRLVSGSPSQGGMSFGSYELPSADGYTSQCMFSIIQVDPATRSVWGSFTCETLTDFTNPTGCSVGPSYFFFDHCTKP